MPRTSPCRRWPNPLRRPTARSLLRASEPPRRARPKEGKAMPTIPQIKTLPNLPALPGLDAKPFLASVGVGDIALERIRERVSTFPTRVTALPTRVTTEVPAAVAALPAQVQEQ